MKTTTNKFSGETTASLKELIRVGESELLMGRAGAGAEHLQEELNEACAELGTREEC